MQVNAVHQADCLGLSQRCRPVTRLLVDGQRRVEEGASTGPGVCLSVPEEGGGGRGSEGGFQNALKSV